MKSILGCIADDITGATDLALMLGRNGMPVAQIIGCPAANAPWPEEAAAVVVALKSRTAPPAEAVGESLAAGRWLRDRSVRQYFFKYCSTFDSTTEGNIGPVAAALGEMTGAQIIPFCPAFPGNQRTVYKGHLFVGDRLLSESSMREHPSTPMKEADLVRFLSCQLPQNANVGLISYESVRKGASEIEKNFEHLAAKGVRYAVVDALNDLHLAEIGKACAGLPLITGGSAVAMGLPENYRAAGWLPATTGLVSIEKRSGPAAVLAGSCSMATREQVAHMAATSPALKVDPLCLADGRQRIADIVAWAVARMQHEPILVYASASPGEVAIAQERLGTVQAAALVEEALAAVAAGMRRQGLKQLIVAGGETSGAVLRALNVKALRIGPEIEPGVPWTVSTDDDLVIALKSGNFGSPAFFKRALEMLT